MSVLEKFNSEGIVSDLIDEAPASLLKVTYEDASVGGSELTPTQVKNEPKVEWESEGGSYYTLLMTGKIAR